MTPAPRMPLGRAGFCVAVLASTALLLGGVYWAIDRALAAGDTVLASCSGPLAGLMAAGGWLSDLQAHAAAGFRFPLAAGALALALFASRRGETPRPAAHLFAALGLAWAGNAFLLHGPATLAAVAYATAAALVLRHPAPSRAPRFAPALIEVAGVVTALAAFVLVTAWATDVRPDLNYDEFSYGLAARIWRGDSLPGKVGVYSFAKFRGQPIPLALHGLALGGLDGGASSLRFVSLAGATLALALAATALRQHLGSAPVLGMLALTAVAPPLVTYGRLAEYVILSAAHAALAFALALRLRARRDGWSAVLLGAVLGSSVYFYQLSWFVPALVAATLAVWPDRWRGARGLRTIALAAGVAVLVAVPEFTLLAAGFRAVAMQSFDRGVWAPRAVSPRTESAILVVPPAGDDEDGVEARAAAFRERGVEATVVPMAGHRVLSLGGPSRTLGEVRDELRAAGWMDVYRRPSTAADDLIAATRQLLVWPSPDRIGHPLLDVPVLNPLFSPLLLVGMTMALRGWRDPVLRALLVWVALATVLPATVAGPAPRRTVLALPFAGALAALPLCALAEAARAGGRWRRWATAALLAAVVAAVACIDLEHAFRHWDADSDDTHLAVLRTASRFSQTELLILSDGLSPGEFARYSRLVAPHAPLRRVLQVRQVGRRRDLGRLLCQESLPLVWIAEGTGSARRLARAVRRRFHHQVHETPTRALVHVLPPRPAVCAKLRRAARPVTTPR